MKGRGEGVRRKGGKEAAAVSITNRVLIRERRERGKEKKEEER